MPEVKDCPYEECKSHHKCMAAQFDAVCFHDKPKPFDAKEWSDYIEPAMDVSEVQVIQETAQDETIALIENIMKKVQEQMEQRNIPHLSGSGKSLGGEPPGANLAFTTTSTNVFVSPYTWRTMVSAPRDGTEILICCEYGKRVAKYQPWEWNVNCEWFIPLHSGDCSGLWIMSPTAWMPLP